MNKGIEYIILPRNEWEHCSECNNTGRTTFIAKREGIIEEIPCYCNCTNNLKGVFVQKGLRKNKPAFRRYKIMRMLEEK